MVSRDQIIANTTRDQLSLYQSHGLTPTDEEIRIKVFEQINLNIHRDNITRPKGIKGITTIDVLPNIAIAIILMFKFVFHKIKLSESRDCPYMLIMYNEAEGIYDVINTKDLTLLASQVRIFNEEAMKKDIDDIYSKILSSVDEVKETRDPNLTPVGNGVFDDNQKALLPFDPLYIFLKKIKTEYNPNAQNISISDGAGGTWDLDSWILDVAGSADVAQILWEVMAAIVRPFKNFGKAVFLYNTKGNNGKSTFCVLLKSLVGKTNVACISFDDLGKDFMLSELLWALTIISDEIDMSNAKTQTKFFKAITTGDMIQLNRKHEAPFGFEFSGLIVQCINGMINVQDASDAFMRRNLFVPFDKCFTGAENKAIKDDYVQRETVLEYALYKALNMDFKGFSESESCQKILDEYRYGNDLVRQFLDDILKDISGNALPYSWIKDIYLKWLKRNYPKEEREFRRNAFYHELREKLADYPEWECTKPGVPESTGGLVSTHDNIITIYNLNDEIKIRPSTFEGIKRVKNTVNTGSDA